MIDNIDNIIIDINDPRSHMAMKGAASESASIIIRFATILLKTSMAQASSAFPVPYRSTSGSTKSFSNSASSVLVHTEYSAPLFSKGNMRQLKIMRTER